MAYFSDPTATYSEQREAPSVLDRVVKSVITTGLIALPIGLALKNPSIRRQAFSKLNTLARYKQDATRMLQTEFTGLARRLYDFDEMRDWAGGTAFRELVNERLRTSGTSAFSLLRQHGIDALEEGEARALYLGTRGTTNNWGLSLGLDLLSGRPVQAEYAKFAGDAAQIAKIELGNKLARNRTLARFHGILEATTGDEAARHQFFQEVVQLARGLPGEKSYEEGMALSLHDRAAAISLEVKKTMASSLRARATGRPQNWIERQLGLQHVSAGEYIQHERSRILSKLSGDDAVKKSASFDAFVDQQQRILGDLSKVRAGRFVYKDADGNIINLEGIGSFLNRARAWADTTLHIPGAGIYPSRMLPWIPRKRQGAFRLINDAATRQFGYSDLVDNVFQMGNETFRVSRDAGGQYQSTKLGNYIAAEPHGVFERLMRAMRDASGAPNQSGFRNMMELRERIAELPDGKEKAKLIWRALADPQTSPSIAREWASVITKHWDPEYAPTAMRILEDSARRNELLLGVTGTRNALGVLVDTIKTQSLADVSQFDELIHKAYIDRLQKAAAGGDSSIQGVIEILQRGTRTREDRVQVITAIGKLREKEVTSENGQDFVTDTFAKQLNNWMYEKGAENPSSKLVQTHHVLGTVHEMFRNRPVSHDEMVYQELGQEAIRSLGALVGDDGTRKFFGEFRLDVARVHDLLGAQSSLSDTSRMLVQGEAIDGYLRGTIGKGLLEYADGDLVWATPQAYSTELDFVKGMFGIASENEAGLSPLANTVSRSVFGTGTDRHTYLQSYMNSLRKRTFNAQQVNEDTLWSPDPILIKQGGSFGSVEEALPGLAKEFTAGRKRVDDITTRTLWPWGLLERLNPYANKIGIGLGAESVASGPLGMAMAISVRRILPLTVAGYGVSYLNYLSEKGDEPGENGLMGLNDMALAGRRTWERGMIGLGTVTGWRSLMRRASHYLPGFENAQEFPIIGGLLDDRSLGEYNEWVEEGYTKVRSGRWWFTGSRNPIIGGRVKAWLPNIHRRARSDWQETGVIMDPDEFWSQSIVPTPSYPFSPIKHFFNNYSFEDAHEQDRPYPVSSGVFTERLWAGSLGNALLGPLLKPERYHPNLDLESGLDEREVKAARDYLRGRKVDERFLHGNLVLEALGAGTVTVAGAEPDEGLSFGLPGDLSQYADVGASSTERIQAPSRIVSRKAGNGQVVTVRDLGGPQVGGIGGGRGGGGYGYMGDAGTGQAGGAGSYAARQMGDYFFETGIPGTARLYGKRITLPDEARSPHDSLAHASVVGKISEDIAGIYGFGTTALLENSLGISREDSYNEHELANPEMAVSPVESYWRSELGEMPGSDLGSELGRRFIPRRSGQQRLWNPLRNTMPSWLPGPSSFQDYLHGDPYVLGMGFEYLLPGKGRDAVFGEADLTLGHPYGHMLGQDLQTTIDMLAGRTKYTDADSESDATREGRAIHAAFQQVYKAQGRLIAAEQHIAVDDMTGLVDAIIKTPAGAMPVEIKTKSTEALEALTAPEEPHVSQLGLYLEALDAPTGAIYYTSREDPTLSKVFYIQRDRERFAREVSVIREAQRQLKKQLDSGELSELELYTDYEKFRTLALTAPFSDQYKYLDKQMVKDYKNGDLDENQWEEYKRLRGMVKERAVRKQLYRYQYRIDRHQQYAGVIDQIKGAGKFTIEGDERVYQLGGVDLELLQAEFDSKVDPLQEERRSPAEIALEELGIFKGAPIAIRTDGLEHISRGGTPIVQASVYSNGKNVNKELVNQGLTQRTEDWGYVDADMQRRGWGPVRFFTERLMHLDTAFHTKVLNVRSPAEEWERSYIYGAQYGRWETPIRDYIKPIAWSLMGKDPISSTIRGGMIGSLFTGGGRVDINQMKNAAREVGGLGWGLASWKEKLPQFAVRYFYPQGARNVVETGAAGIAKKIWKSATGAKVGMVIGAALSIGRFFGLVGATQGDSNVPTERAEQYEQEEYWDKLKYVKHSNFEKVYMRQAAKREETILRQLLGKLDLTDYDRDYVWKLYNRKWALYEQDPRSEELRSLNTEISKFVGLSTAERLGPAQQRAALHGAVARKTAYGANPEKLSEVIGSMPAYARQVLIEGSKSREDRARIWSTLPQYLRASMWKMYGKGETGKGNLEEYFKDHSLPGPDWAGWQEEVNIQDFRDIYMEENNPGLNPLEVGVWPQVIRDAKERIANLPMPNMRTNNSGRDVRIVVKQLLERAGMEVRSVALQAGEGQIDVNVTYDQTSQVVAQL